MDCVFAWLGEIVYSYQQGNFIARELYCLEYTVLCSLPQLILVATKLSLVFPL